MRSSNLKELSVSYWSHRCLSDLSSRTCECNRFINNWHVW